MRRSIFAKSSIEIASPIAAHRAEVQRPQGRHAGSKSASSMLGSTRVIRCWYRLMLRGSDSASAHTKLRSKPKNSRAIRDAVAGSTGERHTDSSLNPCSALEQTCCSSVRLAESLASFHGSAASNASFTRSAAAITSRSALPNSRACSESATNDEIARALSTSVCSSLYASCPSSVADEIVLRARDVSICDQIAIHGCRKSSGTSQCLTWRSASPPRSSETTPGSCRLPGTAADRC